MKKTVIALFAACAMLLGSGALVSGATAADYPSTVPTKPSTPVDKVVKGGQTLKVTIKIGAGNSKPSGYVVVIFNGKKYKLRVVKGVAVFKTKAPKFGSTKVKNLKYNYKPYKGSVFKKSKGSTQVTVKK